MNLHEFGKKMLQKMAGGKAVKYFIKAQKPGNETWFYWTGAQFSEEFPNAKIFETEEEVENEMDAVDWSGMDDSSGHWTSEDDEGYDESVFNQA